MSKRKKRAQTLKEGLDKGQEKGLRGRHGVRRSEIFGRAENFRWLFWTHRLDRKRKKWVRDKPQEWVEQLLSAQTDGDRQKALDAASQNVQDEIKRHAPLIFTVLKEARFPKKRETQADFLADSIAALGKVGPRRSRDICEEERKKERQRSRHKILRHEFYVECSCGYKGPARNNACRKCGTGIYFSYNELIGQRLL